MESQGFSTPHPLAPPADWSDTNRAVGQPVGRHVRQMLKPGGHLLVTTPFLIRIHDQPVDCTRWTELGLKHLLAECGFAIDDIRTGSWGNRACVTANFTEWPSYEPPLHSLDNEPNFPMVVWAPAQRQKR
jgi:hypothetical protein